MPATVPPPASRILLVDDDDRLRERLGQALTDRGYAVRTASSPAAGLDQLERAPCDYAVVDLRMPGGSGLELVAAIRERSPSTCIVVLTGYGSIATAVDAVRLGAANYLTKPADTDMVLAALARADAAPLTEVPEYAPPSLARTEWEHIQRVLEDCGGNISEAARKLGLHRRTLQRKLQKYPPRS
ncbi:MAG: two-component system response regulator RegA [Myxococcota bacterium]|jgi:two-component system response regulator RegA